MRTFLKWLTPSNATLFLFGAAQHAGLSVGPFREPRIVPAAFVETACGLGLAWAAVALVRGSLFAQRAVLISNLAALAGVTLGVVALAAGGGPRTASNDLYHRVMLALIAATFLLLFLSRSTTGQTPKQRTGTR